MNTFFLFPEAFYLKKKMFIFLSPKPTGSSSKKCAMNTKIAKRYGKFGQNLKQKCDLNVTLLSAWHHFGPLFQKSPVSLPVPPASGLSQPVSCV